MIDVHDNFIGGRFEKATSLERVSVSNPARGDIISTIPDSTIDEVDRAVEAASRAQKPWAKLPAIQRAVLLKQIAAKIRENIPLIARTIVEEQGKILSLAEIEANFAADYIDYMSEWARRIEGEIIPSDRAGENIFLFRQPIGVVAGILPWNFPFFLIARKLAPALITGNAIVIKPSEETPNNASLFAKLLSETDVPSGLVNIVYGRGATTGKALAGHPGIGIVSFTGSVGTGSAIMTEAAKNITKVNLELGGKAPAIVLCDADLDVAVSAITASRVINSGQVCNCAERVYVERGIADEFVAKLSAAMMKTTYGDPLGPKAVDMGPLINAAGLLKVKGLVDAAIAGGAQVITGGEIADLGSGSYYKPTVLANCNNSMDVMRSEIFGPVLPVEIVENIDDAIDRANDSIYGLSSSMFTSNVTSAMRACNELRFGETYINREHFEAMQGFHAGSRHSGIGGADGKHGLYEFTETHTVYIQS
jgi:lactaldehyde dehydrogenase/glycolaldehyde dehydrogenase